MKTASRLLLGGSLVAALAAGTLGLVAAHAQEKPAAPAGDAPDYGALVKSLGDDEFAARTKACEALESAGASARKALEEGAKSEDAQIRWSAQRLLRRLDDGGEAPRPRVLRFDENAGAGQPGVDEPLRDMDRRMEDLRRRLEDLRGGFRFEIQPDAKGARVERHVIANRDGERIDARVDADGKVAVRIGSKGADGKPTEELFEAKDMAALEKDHPEVAEKVKGLIGDPIEFRGLGWPAWTGQGNDILDRLGRPAVAKPALGVTVSEVPPVLRTQLSIQDGEGIVVEEVLPGTPAARLGLRRHDVVLSINGVPVSGAAGVRAAVAAVKEGGALALRILRGGKAEEISGIR